MLLHSPYAYTHRRCTLTQSPKWELFKDVIGSAQCQLRKEPMGCRLNVTWAGLSEKINILR